MELQAQAEQAERLVPQEHLEAQDLPDQPVRQEPQALLEQAEHQVLLEPQDQPVLLEPQDQPVLLELPE
jgi:hypothetical protein